MKKVFVFLADGFEEIEAIGTIDVLRRGEVDVTTVSISDKKEVTGAHNVAVQADTLFSETNFDAGNMLILPGGMPGASNLNAHENLKQLLLKYNNEGKLLAAICAAPLVLGGLGLLKNKRATCYPGFESTLTGARHADDTVVVDGNITTGKGPGFAIDFALKLIEQLQGKTILDNVKKGMLLA